MTFQDLPNTVGRLARVARPPAVKVPIHEAVDREDVRLPLAEREAEILQISGQDCKNA